MTWLRGVVVLVDARMLRQPQGSPRSNKVGPPNNGMHPTPLQRASHVH
jgi:hypothetical protein